MQAACHASLPYARPKSHFFSSWDRVYDPLNILATPVVYRLQPPTSWTRSILMWARCEAAGAACVLR